MTLSPVELALVDRWQRNFPLTERPFAVAGRSLGLDEDATIEAFERLREQDVIARIGAVVKPRTVGASTLAAIQVAPERLEAVATIVSSEPLVNHNYARTHEVNLWFVIAGPDWDAVAATILRIERRTGLNVLVLPLEQAYHLDLGFSLTGDPRREIARPSIGLDEYQPDSCDRGLLAAMEDGLPLVQRPYEDVGRRVGLDESNVIGRIQTLTAAGVVTRFGCVVRHRTLGYTANAMAVWDVPDDLVDDVAACFVRHPQVTLCYRRPRLPVWRYSLYCMVHAKSRRDAFAVIDELNLLADTGLEAQAVLFSARCFKQRGPVFSDNPGGLH